MLEDFLKRTSGAALIVISLILLAGCSARVPVVEKTAWKGFMFDSSRANHSPAPLTPPLYRLWDKDISPIKFFNFTPKVQSSAPLLSDGVLYVGSADNKFYAFNYTSGDLLWKFSAEDPIEAPAVAADGRVCFGSAEGLLRCLDASTGAPLWSFQVKSEILSAPVILGSRLFFYSSNDRLHALDAATGEKLWSYAHTTMPMVSSRIFASPAASGSKLFQLFTDGTLVSLDADSGAVVWKRKVVKSFVDAASARRTPLVYNGLVYVIDDTGTVLAFAAGDGKAMGIYKILKASDILVMNKKVLILAGEEKVVAYEKSTDSILWTKEVEYSRLSSIFAVGDYIFLISRYEKRPLGLKFLAREKGYLRALSADSGDVVWERKFGSTISAGGAGTDSTVALFTDDGVIGVFASK